MATTNLAPAGQGTPPGFPEQVLLDRISYSIANVPYSALTFPEHRAQVLKLAILAGISADTREMVDRLDRIGEDMTLMAETMQHVAEEQKAHHTALHDRLESCDTELTKMGQWFEKSRLFDGLG